MLEKVKELIKEECCNYDYKIYGIYHHCLSNRDHTCRYFRDEAEQCGWLEQAVLPLDSKLEAEYHTELGTEGIEKIRYCKMCTGRFVPRNNRQVYCKTCREKRDKRRKREWWQEKGSD